MLLFKNAVVQMSYFVTIPQTSKSRLENEKYEFALNHLWTHGHFGLTTLLSSKKTNAFKWVIWLKAPLTQTSPVTCAHLEKQSSVNRESCWLDCWHDKQAKMSFSTLWSHSFPPGTSCSYTNPSSLHLPLLLCTSLSVQSVHLKWRLSSHKSTS